MAKGKSSAKSKGYRTYHAKKPFLSKKEWIILIVAAVALIAGFVVAVTVNFDGALQIKDGVVQPRTENALIVNGGTAAHPRYYQVGQLLSLPDGWSMEPGNDINVNTPSYTLLPPETSGVETVSVTVSGQEYQALAKAMIDVMRDAELRRALGRRGAALVRDAGLQAMAERACRLFETWLQEAENAGGESAPAEQKQRAS